jgi:hypothetical protein
MRQEPFSPITVNDNSIRKGRSAKLKSKLRSLRKIKRYSRKVKRY